MFSQNHLLSIKLDNAIMKVCHVVGDGGLLLLLLLLSVSTALNAALLSM